MMKSVVLSLISLFLMAGAQAGVDVKLKFHYNDYPLCNWEVRLEHNSSPVGSVVTDRDGVATFSNITLFSKEVEVYLYMLPPNNSDDWNGHGTVCLNEDYTGEVDFGPVTAGKGSPKAALEKEWNISLDECENLSPEDMHTLPAPTENREKEKAYTDEGGFNPKQTTQYNNLSRIRSLQQELEVIEEKKASLSESGEPKGAGKKKLHKAWLKELEQERLWTDLKLWMVNTQSSGESTLGMVDEEKVLKSRYLNARNERESLEHETQIAVLQREDNTGKSPALQKELTELRTDMAREKQALHNEQESMNPDATRMEELHVEIAKLERRINAIENY